MIKETITFTFDSVEQQKRFHERLDGGDACRADKLEAALTEIRDLLPIEQDNYSRRVFSVAADALEQGAGATA